MKRHIPLQKKILRLVLMLFCALMFTSSLYAQTKKIQSTDYIVQKGDTLYGIARKFNTTLAELCELNGFSKDYALKAGQKIKVPVTEENKSAEKTENKTVIQQTKKENPTPKEKTAEAAVEKKSDKPAEKKQEVKTSEKNTEKKQSSTAEEKKSEEKKSDSKTQSRQFDTYTVQKGDTFWGIAKKNDISVDELKKLNDLNTEATLKIGQKLKIPVTIVDTANTVLPDLTENDPRQYTEQKVDSAIVWPVKNPSVTYTKGKVSGVQLSASKNEDVTAIRAGTVMYCGNYRGYGQVVFVQSKTGQIYAYCGLGTIKVEKGQYIVFGDVVGTAGMDSIKNTPQIMFMVFQKGVPVDPAKAPRG